MRNVVRTFFKGLYGKSEIDFVNGLVYIYPFGLIGKENNNKVKPHLHNNQFHIFLVTEGYTKLIHDGESIIVSAPSFFIVPKNTEHGFEHQPDVKGWIISISDSMAEQMVKNQSDVINAIETFQVTEVIKDSYAETVFENMLECVEEYFQENTGKLLMLQYMIGKIIVQLSRLPKDAQQWIFNKDNASVIYFRRFWQLIRESHNYKKTIEDYAKELKISTGHLNRICSSIAKQTPKEVIMAYFLAEAQLLLSDREKSVNEVCYSIGFEDPSYFSRVFKKKTGLSPNEFRKKQGI